MMHKPHSRGCAHLQVNLQGEQEVRHVQAHVPQRRPALQRLSARLAPQRRPGSIQHQAHALQAQQVPEQRIVLGHHLHALGSRHPQNLC